MRDVQIFIHRFIRTTNNTRTLKNYKRNKRYAAMTRRPSTVIGVDAVQLLLQYTVYRIVGLYISLPQCRSMYRRAPPPPPAPVCTCNTDTLTLHYRRRRRCNYPNQIARRAASGGRRRGELYSYKCTIANIHKFIIGGDTRAVASAVRRAACAAFGR